MHQPAVIRSLRLVIAAIAVSIMFGCAPDWRANMEPYSRNRLHILTRSVSLAVEARRASTQQAVESVRELEAKIAAGADPQTTYDLARRMVATSESRNRIAASRLRVARSQAESLFDEWDEEISEYEDSALKSSSRDNMKGISRGFEEAAEALEEAGDDTEPVLILMNDRLLYIKHHRNAAALPPAPERAETPEEAVGRLEASTNRAGEVAAAFLSSIHEAP